MLTIEKQVVFELEIKGKQRPVRVVLDGNGTQERAMKLVRNSYPEAEILSCYFLGNAEEVL